ncbi:methylosome subunit pICln domain protein [Cooperia oncophora]
MITDDTRLRILRLVREVFEILGEEWFSPNLSLLLLLVHIAVVQVRMCLDKPDNINSQSLAICYHIIEMAIRCVEESSLLDDSMATRLATVVREVAFYSIEYWVEAKQQGEHLDDNVELVLYRFVSCLLAVDGAEMLPASLMEQCSSLLLDVFQREIANGNHSVAHLLLPNLHVLPKLSENVILSLVELLISRYADSHWKDTEDEVALPLKAWTLANARLKLEQTIPDCELSKLLAKLMIILSETNEPTEGVRLSQPQVVAYLDGECAGEGRLCVAESQVTWICRSSGLGFSLTYPSIILHAISTDLSTFPHECIYVLVDASKSDLKLAEEELNRDDDASEDDEDEGKNVVIRFVPSDLKLQQVYTEMCNCQELNPDENDDFSDEDADGEMIVGESGDSMINEDGWYTAENIGDGEHVELSEEGRANLNRILNRSRNGCGDHEDTDENGMDEQ